MANEEKLDPWSENMGFGAICDCFEKISSSHDKNTKVQMLRKFLDRARDRMSLSVNVKEKESSSLYPVLRLFLPQIDRERGSYGIKETLLARLFIDLLQIGAKSKDAIKLK